MRFIEKVASYYDAYRVTSAEDSLLKTASVDGVSKDDLVAYHNLTNANIFTGENVIEVEGDPTASDSKLIQLGFTIDKVASEGLSDDLILEKAAELGLDSEDVGFVVANIQRQMEEAGLADGHTKVAGDIREKVAQAVKMLREEGIDPKEAFEIYLNIDEEGNFIDEKVAEVAAKYTDADFDKIAEAIELIGQDITPEIAQIIIEEINS